MVLLESKNRNEEPSFGKKCLCEKLDILGFDYSKDMVTIDGYDAYLSITMKN